MALRMFSISGVDGPGNREWFPIKLCFWIYAQNNQCIVELDGKHDANIIDLKVKYYGS
jgi:hypothetical protein